jgi:hypothetical protein
LLTLFRAFLAICRLRKGPQDLPASPELLSLTLFAYVVMTACLTMLLRPPVTAIGASLVETALIAGLNFALLALRRLEGRWLQTTTAMAGTGIVFSLIAVPIYAGLGAGDAGGALMGVLYSALLLLVVWSVAVAGHILRHALSLPFPAGVVLAAAYTWVVAAAVSGLFPEPA